MKITTVVLSAFLMAASTAFAAAPAAAPAKPAPILTPSAPETLNPAQVAVVKNALIERYKTNIAMLQSGQACLSKVVTHEQLQACMSDQAKSASVERDKATVTSQKMAAQMQVLANKK